MPPKRDIEVGRDMYLRSSTIGTSLSGFLSLLADITSRGIRASSTTASAVIMIGVMVCSFHILHGLVIIAARWPPGKVGDLVLNIHILPLQQNINNLTQFQIPRAEPARVTTLMLGLRLQPEEIALGAGRELQNKHASICSVLARRSVGSKASI
jgi:hypothetical protein